MTGIASWLAMCITGALAQAPTKGLDRLPNVAVADDGTEVGIRRYHAVLFGAWDYGDKSGLADLVSPKADIEQLGALLRDQYGFEVKLVPNATEDTIAAELAALTALPPEDAVLVYYSGHGVRDNVRGYWLPEDADARVKSRWVSGDDVLVALQELKTKHVLLISDSCFAGELLKVGPEEAPVATPEDAERARLLTAKQSRWYISSGGNEPVLDTGCDGMSVFSCELRRLLKDATARYVIPDTFFFELRDKVEARSALIGGVGNKQRPQQDDLLDDADGQLVMVNRNACPEPLAAKMAKLEAAASAAWDAVVAAPSEGAVEAWLAAWRDPRPVEACGAGGLFVPRDRENAWQLLAVMKGAPVIRLPTAEELGMTFVEIPGGTFWMGSSEKEQKRALKTLPKDTPQDAFADEGRHEVTVSPFVLMDKEVTQAQVEAVLGENPARTRRYYGGAEHGPCSNRLGKLSLVDPAYPAICVTWLEAVEVANALSRAEGLTPAYRIEGDDVSWDRSANGYRLPTEAEWEYAARARTKTPWGGPTNRERDLCALGNVADEYLAQLYRDNDVELTVADCSDGAAGLAQAGSYAVNPFGLYDMVGNVWEWTWDAYAPYGPVVGIGASLEQDDEGYITVTGMVPGSLALQDGRVRVEDRIVAVAQGKSDPVDVVGMGLEEVVSLIRGHMGTEVRVHLEHADGTREVVAIVRDQIGAADPAVSAGAPRVYRGGGWNVTPAVARVAIRGWNEPGNRRLANLGFRLARSVP